MQCLFSCRSEVQRQGAAFAKGVLSGHKHQGGQHLHQHIPGITEKRITKPANAASAAASVYISTQQIRKGVAWQ